MVIFDRKLKEYYERIFSLEGGQVSCCVNAGLAAVYYSVGGFDPLGEIHAIKQSDVDWWWGGYMIEDADYGVGLVRG